jgi:excisionase family DNA binding protein
MKAYLNASEVAELLNVNRATVTRWIKKGVIRDAVRVGSRHQWRIPLSSYEELVRQRKHEDR